ncbi:hypothetical protein Tco_0251685 [Tanacetum coccineum]
MFLMRCPKTAPMAKIACIALSSNGRSVWKLSRLELSVSLSFNVGKLEQSLEKMEWKYSSQGDGSIGLYYVSGIQPWELSETDSYACGTLHLYESGFFLNISSLAIMLRDTCCRPPKMHTRGWGGQFLSSTSVGSSSEELAVLVSQTFKRSSDFWEIKLDLFLDLGGRPRKEIGFLREEEITTPQWSLGRRGQ